jgi:hypothetical protein
MTNILATTFAEIARNADDDILDLFLQIECTHEAGECQDYKDLVAWYVSEVRAAMTRRAMAADLAVECALD